MQVPVHHSLRVFVIVGLYACKEEAVAMLCRCRCTRLLFFCSASRQLRQATAVLGSKLLPCVRCACAGAVLCFTVVLRGSARRGQAPAGLIPAVSRRCCAGSALGVGAAAWLLEAVLVRRMLSAACLAIWHLDGTAVLVLAVSVVALRLVVAQAERLFAMRDLQVLHGAL